MPEKRCDIVRYYREWKRKHPNYPLTPHPSGQWAKKVRGKLYYFGRLSEPDEALTLWLEEKDYLLAGLEPPTYTGGGLTVGELCEQHSNDIEDRISRGELSVNTRGNYQPVRKLLYGSGLRNVQVDTLTPEHFITVQQWLVESNYNLNSRRKLISSMKGLFKWGKEMGLYEKAIHYGPRLTSPPQHAIEAEQEELGTIRFFNREILLEATKVATPKMKAIILLGINCAFYPSDIASIAYGHLHLDAPIPYHDFRRVKTRQRRMAALWPETVDAINEYLAFHRPPNDSRIIFLSKLKKPYTKTSFGQLTLAFNKLLERVGDRQKGVSIGSLRHTYGTVMDLVNDTQMVDLTMGHVAGTVRGRAGKSLQRRIYSQFNINELKRLKAVADVVHDWLFDGKYCEPE